jgi:hypothetical protein
MRGVSVGEIREEIVHGDDEDECIGCPQCADPACPACKGTGRVQHGAFGSWMCGCTYEVVGSPQYAERIARDIATLSRVPYAYARRIGGRYLKPDNVCAPLDRCAAPCGECSI